VFPLEGLREIEAEGVVGSLNGRHFLFMGYIPVVEPLLQETGPEIAQKLRGDGVDLVVASRYMEGASTGDLPPQRVRMSTLPPNRCSRVAR